MKVKYQEWHLKKITKLKDDPKTLRKKKKKNSNKCNKSYEKASNNKN